MKINAGLLLIAGLLCFAKGSYAQKCEKITFDFDNQQQTIHSFGASDCWRTQYIGRNWPLEKRNRIADLLFSTETDEWGNPKGIGLSLWRFNIGSGSHEAGDAGGVASDWRRTECFLGKKVIGIGINRRGSAGCYRPPVIEESVMRWAFLSLPLIL